MNIFRGVMDIEFITLLLKSCHQIYRNRLIIDQVYRFDLYESYFGNHMILIERI